MENTRSVLLLGVVAAVCVTFVIFAAKWNFANAVSTRTDLKEIVEIAVGFGPSDPQTHFAAAVIFQKTFEPADLGRSLSEYEMSTALSPNNYLNWLELGKARQRDGDTEGAERAIKKALDLAPNYADVQWAYGNTLLRAGRMEEAFEHIRQAAADKPTLGNPAVVTAMQVMDGDAERVRRSVGNTAVINSSIATYLITQKRYGDAVDSWEKISNEERRNAYKDAGAALANSLLGAGQYRFAAKVTGDISEDRSAVPGTVFDGGFELGVKLKDARTFEWQIGDGTEPQIALSNSQKHGGTNSLLLVFNTMQAADFRQVSQTVAVEPNAVYEFGSFVRTEVKAQITVRWEIFDITDGKSLGRTEPVSASGDWTSLNTKFTVPVTSDGIVIRLVRADCPSSVCPINGRVWIDDVAIRKL